MVPTTQRTYVYIDGFNFYYRALQGGPFKWLDYLTLCQKLLNSTNNIEKIKYYTARVSGRSDPDEPKRQQVYLNALATIPCLEIFYGSFLAKIITRPLVGQEKHFVDVHSAEEKGSDVNLATHLVFDACQDKFDVGIVLSKDTDLVEPIRIARDELGKVVGIVCPDENLPEPLKRVASFCKHVRKQHLNESQFPNRIQGATQVIEKPSEWYASRK